MSVIEVHKPADLEQLRKFTPGQQVRIYGVADNTVFNVSLYTRQNGVEVLYMSALEQGFKPRNLRRPPPAPPDHAGMLWTIDQLKQHLTAGQGFLVDQKVAVNPEEKQVFPVVGGGPSAPAQIPQQSGAMDLTNPMFLNQLRVAAVQLAQTPNNTNPLPGQLFAGLASILGALMLVFQKK